MRTAEMSNLRQMTAAVRGEELKVMLPMMMNKLYSTDTMQKITSLAYELLGADGMRYQGEFRGGVPSGVGTLQAADGSTYRGEFSAGRPDGEGVYSLPTGESCAV